MGAKGTVNRVILVGNLGHDPELKQTSSGTPVTTLSLATHEVWNDPDDNKAERTDWHRVVLWEKLAEVADHYLTKGSKVYIEGRLQTRSWEDKDGVTRYTTEIIAQKLTILDSKTDESPEPESAEPEEAAEPKSKSSSKKAAA